jgi:hypothetical protein
MHGKNCHQGAKAARIHKAGKMFFGWLHGWCPAASIKCGPPADPAWRWAAINSKVHAFCGRRAAIYVSCTATGKEQKLLPLQRCKSVGAAELNFAKTIYAAAAGSPATFES